MYITLRILSYIRAYIHIYATSPLGIFFLWAFWVSSCSFKLAGWLFIFIESEIFALLNFTSTKLSNLRGTASRIREANEIFFHCRQARRNLLSRGDRSSETGSKCWEQTESFSTLSQEVTWTSPHMLLLMPWERTGWTCLTSSYSLPGSLPSSWIGDHSGS